MAKSLRRVLKEKNADDKTLRELMTEKNINHFVLICSKAGVIYYPDVDPCDISNNWGYINELMDVPMSEFAMEEVNIDDAVRASKAGLFRDRWIPPTVKLTHFSEDIADLSGQSIIVAV